VGHGLCACEVKTFLLINLALAFYNVGTIWAHEVDIFRTWKLVGAHFHNVQTAHWKKLPYWVLAPVGLAFAGSIALFWYHPVGSPMWAVAGNFGCQAASLLSTAIFWGPWQAALSRDPSGAKSILLERILKTHWMRTALVSGAALILLAWAIQS
jgi:hypothetical protein